jgi:regulator of sirC expression with transglutaminase-like and TPR domain
VLCLSGCGSTSMYTSVHFRSTNCDAQHDADTAQVLENRTGIPITMALVYTNIASRVGLPMIGINLPG